MKPKDLDAKDQLSYEKLVTYVRIFTPARCVDMDNNLLFYNNVEYLIVNRLINTKALFECFLDEEALRLLGRGHACESLFVCFPCD